MNKQLLLMTKKIGQTLFVGLLLAAFTFALTSATADAPNPQKLIKKMEKAMGGWNKLYKLNDVQFTYNYEYPGQHKKDRSIEKYIFEGEHSWAKYDIHQINVLPNKAGTVIQSYVHDKASMSHDGKIMKDDASVGLSHFLRKANYYWFTMMYKLSDPGVKLSMMDGETVNGINYHKVRVDFNPTTVGKAENDIYVLYINPKTKLVDQFLFSLPARGVMQPVILMTVQYQTVNGVKVPAKRSVYQPGADGQLSKTANLVQTSSNIKFNNGFSPEDLMIK